MMLSLPARRARRLFAGVRADPYCRRTAAAFVEASLAPQEALPSPGHSDERPILLSRSRACACRRGRARRVWRARAQAPSRRRDADHLPNRGPVPLLARAGPVRRRRADGAIARLAGPCVGRVAAGRRLAAFL